MTEISKIYLNFNGAIPDLDSITDGDWYIIVVGKPVQEDMLVRLTKFLTELTKSMIDSDDVIEYEEICEAAEKFMVNEYDYELYDEPDKAAFEVKINV